VYIFVYPDLDCESVSGSKDPIEYGCNPYLGPIRIRIRNTVVEERISKLSLTAEFHKAPYPDVDKTDSDNDN
jgi:hypothetical protein